MNKWLSILIAVITLASFFVVAASYSSIEAPQHAFVALCIVNLFAFLGSLGMLKNAASKTSTNDNSDS